MSVLSCLDFLSSTTLTLLNFRLLLRPGRGAEYCDEFVCLSASVSLEPLNRSSQNFACRSLVAVARSSSRACFNFWQPWPRNFIISMQIHSRNIWVKLVHQVIGSRSRSRLQKQKGQTSIRKIHTFAFDWNAVLFVALLWPKALC